MDRRTPARVPGPRPELIAATPTRADARRDHAGCAVGPTRGALAWRRAGAPGAAADGAICVDANRLISVHPARGASLRVECLAGHVWVTQDGRYDDVILAAGQTFAAVGGGKVVVQAYAPALVRLTRD